VQFGGFAPAFTLSFHDSERSRKPPMPIASVVKGHSKKNKETGLRVEKSLMNCPLFRQNYKEKMIILHKSNIIYNMKRNLLIGLTVLLFLSCEKSNIADYENYIGVWSNVSGNLTRTLEVKSNGKSFYEVVKTKGNTSTNVSFNGNFVLKDSTLTIGFKKLTINEEPTMTNGSWYLIMDQSEYKRE